MISISIIVPAYNVERFITRCLESIDSQDYRGNMECIIVDDCSTDGTLNVVKQFIDSHFSSKIIYKLFIHKNNEGVSVARNNALNIAIGDYIYFLDGDDHLHPNTISLLAAQVERYPGIDMVMGTFDNGDNKTYHDLQLYKQKKYIDSPELIQYVFLRNDADLNITSTDKLTRRKFLIDNKISFLPRIIIHEDNHWLYQVLCHIKTFAFVFEKTYIRYINPDSATHTINRKTELKNWHHILIDCSKFIPAPMRRLKLGRLMVRYFYDRLFELNLPNDSIIRLNFMKSAIICAEYKVAAMLVASILFPRYCLRKDMNEHLKQHASRIFQSECSSNEKLLTI